MAVSMAMAEYVTEIRHAISNLLPLIWDERQALIELTDHLSALAQRTEEGYQAADLVALNADDDDVMLATARHWDTYWGPDRERHYVAREHQQLDLRVQARRFSVSALAGTVLQQARQGLALIHGRQPRPPQGRPIGTQQVSTVVWQARNQALHWEEQNFHEPVRACFQQLATDLNPIFHEYARRNLAVEVLDALGWYTREAFEQDMLTMG